MHITGSVLSGGIIILTMTDDGTDNGQDGYAGVYGVPIDRFQIIIR